MIKLFFLQVIGYILGSGCAHGHQKLEHRTSWWKDVEALVKEDIRKGWTRRMENKEGKWTEDEDELEEGSEWDGRRRKTSWKKDPNGINR